MTFFTKRAHYQRVLLGGAVLLFLVIIAAVNFGVANISVKQTWLVICSKLPILNHLFLQKKPNPAAVTIIFNLRLPRILLTALAGAGLAVAGATFQGIFKNPMAEPYVLGISSGAALGAAVAMAFGAKTDVFGFGLITVCAFVGGVLTAFIVYNIARIGNRVPNITLLLSGIAVNFFLTAIISLIMTFKREQIERIVMWTMGSVATAGWNEVGMVLPVVLLTIGTIFVFARDLNLILLGDESARSLGVEVEKVKKYLLFITTLTVAAIVSSSGIIGFVGLIVPHMIRLLFGSDHRIVIPFSALGGAILLIICDTLARTVASPDEIPLGIVTSLFGVPFFLYQISKQKKKV